MEQNILRRNSYQCTACKQPTVECRFCENMARRGEKWDAECCAVHDGTIGSFTSLNTRLSDITEWRRVTARDGYNMMKVAKVAGGATAIAVLATGAGVVAAPAIGGAIGSLAGLSGAAAASHGLAVLGGGALAAGGLGIAGGTALIAVSAAVLGGAGGGVLVNKFAGEIDGFDIRIRRKGERTKVVVVNGFLSGEDDLIAEWKGVLRTRFTTNPWYEVSWESKCLRDLGNVALAGTGSAALQKVATKLAAKATNQAGAKMGPLALLKAAIDFSGNPWFVTMAKAEKTGQLLADLILRTDGRTRYILLGHSLGARVVYFALQALAESGRKPRISEAHLLGGAVDCSNTTWSGVSASAQGKIFNYHCRHDDVLGILYRTASLFCSEPIGITPINDSSGKIVNVDVSAVVKGHGDFKSKFPEYIYGRNR